MHISEIPNEIYIVACEYEDIDLAEWGENRAKDAFRHETQTRRHYTDGGLEKAICDYLMKQGEFAEDGRFEQVSNEGWSHD